MAVDIWSLHMRTPESRRWLDELQTKIENAVRDELLIRGDRGMESIAQGVAHEVIRFIDKEIDLYWHEWRNRHYKDDEC